MVALDLENNCYYKLNKYEYWKFYSNKNVCDIMDLTNAYT